MMGRLISSFGYQAVVARSGPEGIAMAKQAPPDLVLCDVGLPGMDGYQVAACLTTEPEMAGVPMVAISGFGRDTDVARALAAGFTEHLLKPVNPARLKETLKRHLGATRSG